MGGRWKRQLAVRQRICNPAGETSSPISPNSPSMVPATCSYRTAMPSASSRSLLTVISHTWRPRQRRAGCARRGAERDSRRSWARRTRDFAADSQTWFPRWKHGARSFAPGEAIPGNLDLDRVLDGKIVLDEAALEIPMKWKSSKIIFVNSMSDLFHERFPVEFIARVFGVMRGARHHTFQVLTKRAERLAQVASELPWPDNVWMGVSVESKDYINRIDHLRSTPAYIKFLSLEPLLGPLDNLNLHGIDWTIAGGESGPAARAMDPEWVRSIRDQCVDAGVAFHFKQWGGVQKKQTGRILDGRTWDELPRTRILAA